MPSKHQRLLDSCHCNYTTVRITILMVRHTKSFSLIWACLNGLCVQQKTGLQAIHLIPLYFSHKSDVLWNGHAMSIYYGRRNEMN